ncbi:MAG: hypothetical protein WCS73_00335 [Lentisphaeria bacterium]
MSFDNSKIAKCEKLLRAKNRCDEVKFGLLSRFAELPASVELMKMNLKEKCPEEYALVSRTETEDGFFSDSLESSFDSEAELSPEENSLVDDLMEHQNFGSMELPKYAKMLESFDARGRRIASVLFQSVLDWSNINSILLTDKFRLSGIRILFLFSRAMAFLNDSMTDGVSMELPRALVYGRRSLFFTNLAIGEIKKLSEVCPPVKGIITARMKELYLVADELQDHLISIYKIGESGESF